MKITFASRAWEATSGGKSRTARSSSGSNTLIADVARNGNEGIGKPEPLKHGFQGYWYRRINDEHRLICKVTDDSVLIAQCRYHYES